MLVLEPEIPAETQQKGVLCSALLGGALVVKQRGEQSAGETRLQVFSSSQCAHLAQLLAARESRVCSCCRPMLAALGGSGEQLQALLSLHPG